MAKIFKVKMPKKGKTPRNAPSKSDAASVTGYVVGRASLAKLSSAQLYKLLQYKNLPNRSKARSKDARVEVLDDVVTRADLEAAGLVLPTRNGKGTRNGEVLCTTGKKALVKASVGGRFDVPVAEIDVHKDVLVVAIVVPEGSITRREFPNTANGASDLARLLRRHGVQHAAMESTAEYWLKPFWVLSDAGVEVLVANPVQTKATQGVKTDYKDALRIAFAFRDDRLKPSVIVYVS